MSENDRYGATDEEFGEDDPETRPKFERETGFDDEETSIETAKPDSQNASATQTSPANTDSQNPNERTSADSQQSIEQLPLILRRRSVKDERRALTLYVTDDVRQELNQMKVDANSEFDNEEVQVLDVYAAVIRNGLNKSGVIDELENMGYGLR